MNIPSLASSACLGAELSKSEAFPYREFVSRIRNGAHDAPRSRTGQFACQVENFILNVKHERASWGARKIRERLLRRFSGIPIPAKSTIHAVLESPRSGRAPGCQLDIFQFFFRKSKPRRNDVPIRRGVREGRRHVRRHDPWHQKC